MQKIDDKNNGEATVVAVRLSDATVAQIDKIVAENTSIFGSTNRSSVARTLMEMGLASLPASRPAQASAPVAKPVAAIPSAKKPERKSHWYQPTKRSLSEETLEIVKRQSLTAYRIAANSGCSERTVSRALVGFPLTIRSHSLITKAIERYGVKL